MLAKTIILFLLLLGLWFSSYLIANILLYFLDKIILHFKRLLRKIEKNIELRKLDKYINDYCEVTGIYANKRSGLTIKKIN